MEWFFITEGRRIGPIPDNVFRELARNGSLLRTTSVWCQGMPTWVLAGAVDGLMPPKPVREAPTPLSRFLKEAGSKPYRDLVQHHLQRCSSSHLQKATLGETATLPLDYRGKVVDYIDAVGAMLSYDAEFWGHASCETALVRVLTIARSVFAPVDVPLSLADALLPEKHALAFSLFQIATLSIAYSASAQKKQREFMGIRKGLFG
ncbi:MAG: DUF4339 domain-containing protein [Candidatus Krumholzibacteriia bacterium]